MSVKVMAYVWEYSMHKGSELITMLAIADHADDAGYAYPSIGRLAQKTRMTARNVQYVLKKLLASQELIIHESQGPHRVHMYQIPLDETKSFQGEKFSGVKGENFSGVKSFQGETQRRGGVKNSAPALKNARGVLRDPSLEPSEKEKENTHPPPPLRGGAVAEVSFSAAADKTRNTDYPQTFERWWQTYPDHNCVAKKDCAKTWKTKHLDPRTDEIIAHTEAMKHTKQWKEGKIPNTTKYLSEERYDTPPPESTASSGTSDALMAQLLEIEREALDRQARERKAHP